MACKSSPPLFPSSSPVVAYDTTFAFSVSQVLFAHSHTYTFSGHESHPDLTHKLKSRPHGQATPACSSHALGIPGRAIISKHVLVGPAAFHHRSKHWASTAQGLVSAAIWRHVPLIGKERDHSCWCCPQKDVKARADIHHQQKLVPTAEIGAGSGPTSLLP